MAKRIYLSPPQPMISDIELFAKAYFNIELTSTQLQYIASVAAGVKNQLIKTRQRGNTTAHKVIIAYLQEGLKLGGRVRLPQHPLPVKEPKTNLKGFSQEGKVLALIKRSTGAYNFELSRVALKYSSRIAELRKEGHQIIAERQYLKNGRASNTWKYRLGGQ